MKRLFLFIVLIASATFLYSQAQYDSIYTSNEGVLAVSVKEIATEEVRFSYPNEDLINSLPKSNILKIVFKSGRVQMFSEATSYKKVTCVEDWENVSVSRLESEIRGLFKVGDVSVKAKNASGLASSSKINDRAYQKLKMETALKGGNIVFIVSETSVGNKMGTQFQAAQAAETQISGIAYTNQLPNIDNFKKTIADKTYKLYKKDVLGNNSITFNTDAILDIPTLLTDIQEKDRFIHVNSVIKGADGTDFIVTYFDPTRIVLMEENKGKVTNYTLKIE